MLLEQLALLLLRLLQPQHALVPLKRDALLLLLLLQHVVHVVTLVSAVMPLMSVEVHSVDDNVDGVVVSSHVL